MKFWSISPTLLEFYRHSLLERAGKHPVTWQQCQSADDFECSLYWFTFETKSYLKWIFRSTLHQNDDHFVWIQFNKGVKQNVCLSFKRRVFEVLLKQCTYLKSKHLLQDFYTIFMSNQYFCHEESTPLTFSNSKPLSNQNPLLIN